MLLYLMALAASPPRLTSPAPIDAANWIRTDDYPKKDQRGGITGSVRFRLDVDVAGGVHRCVVVASSGDRLLDDTTCRLLRARARFTPPIDAAGKSIASTYESVIRWTLPSSLPFPVIGYVPPIQLAAVPNRVLPRPARSAFSLPAMRIEPIAAPVHVRDDEIPPQDPAVRTGQLPNGLRYLIMRNAVPPGGMSMRMHVAAGPIDETDAQRGYAHFVEHMTFRGTANVPDGQLVKSFEQMGLALGADTTANTTPEETIFGLDFPPSRSSTLTAGLFLLREMASRATFAPTAVAAERGVILSEERLRDDAALHAELTRNNFLLEGQRMASRVTIGTIGTISNATAPALQSFYKTHYRPDRIDLIIVGDADPDEIENSIRASFSDWTVKEAPPDTQDQGGVRLRSEQIKIFTEPGAPERAEVDWVSAYDPSPDTLARESRQLAEQIAAAILNDRLVRLSQAPDAPFVSATVQTANLFHSARVTTLSVVAPGQPTKALAAALIEQRRLVQLGVARMELERVTTRMRNALMLAAESSISRESRELANELLESVTGRHSFTTPVQTKADFAQIAAKLTVADIASGAARLFGGAGPLIFVATSKPWPDGETMLRSALSRADAQPLQASPAIATAPWPYSSFGRPGTISSRQEIADLGVTIARFQNGTSVTIKTSPVPKDQIVVAASFGAGLAGLPPGLERSYWAVSAVPQLFINGGLNQATVLDIRDQLDGKVVGAEFQAREDRFVIAGRTRPRDFNLQLQLVTAYLTDAAFHDNAWTQARDVVATSLDQIDASASATADRQRALLLHGGDRRWSVVPTAADLASGKSTDIAAMLRPSLSGPIDLVIVGDVDVDRAIEAARHTIGSLPARGPLPSVRGVGFPGAQAAPAVITNHARPDQGVAIAAWPTEGFYSSTPDSRALQVLAGIIDARLIDGLREKDGLTYSPLVGVDQSQLFPSYGSLVAQVEISPAKAATFFTEIDLIIADLAKAPVSSEELDRARTPIMDQTRTALRIADYWAEELASAAADPRQLDAMRSRLPELGAVKPADVQRVAKKFLAGKMPYRAIVESVSAKR